MKVLLLCPLHPFTGVCGETKKSIEALDVTGFDVTVHYDITETQSGNIDRNQSVLEKFQNGRRLFLAGDYDAMLTVEYDNIVPVDALQKLARVDADVAYGLYCSRVSPRWLAFWRLFENSGITYSKDEPTARAAWGNVIETCGVGYGCTLIHRHVLEALPFRLVNGHPCSNDWHFSLDCIKAGFVQKHDCSVIVGHIITQDPLTIVWPIPDEPFHRIEVAERKKPILKTAEGVATYICLDNVFHSQHEHYYAVGDEITLTDDVAERMLALGKVVAKSAKEEPVTVFKSQDEVLIESIELNVTDTKKKKAS